MAVTAAAEVPLAERLKFDSPLHQKIISYVCNRRRAAEEAINPLLDSWDRVDDHWALRLNLDDPVRRIDGSADYSMSFPFDYGVVLPATYAGLIVRLFQELATVTQRDPIFELAGTGPEDVFSALVMEGALAHDVRMSQGILQLWSLFQDAERYGRGILRDSWRVERGNKVIPPKLDIDRVDMLPLPGPAKKAVKTLLMTRAPQLIEPTIVPNSVIREYAWMRTIDPRWFYQDPDYAASQLQRANFCGHREPANFLELKAEEAPNGDYFNLERAKELTVKRRRDDKRRDQRSTGRADGAPIDEYENVPLDIDHLECRLVPKELELSPTEYPEIWIFETVDDAVVIAAHPAPNWHQRYGYSIGEVQPDPHCFSNPGYGEHVEGMQNYINWMVSADYQYTVKRINNALVYSPELLDSNDLFASNIAGHIKVKPYALSLLVQGRITQQDLFRQLEMPDTTANMLDRAMRMMDQIQREFGSSDPMSGMPLPTKRTYGEVSLVTQMASQRIVQVVQLIDEMCLEPTVMRMVANRQQFTDLQKYIRITGDLVQQLGQQNLLLRRYDLYGDFDYEKINATRPVDPARQTETVLQFMQTLAQAGPQVMGMFNWPMLFGEIARDLGFRHWDRFILPPPPGPVNVVDDQEYEDMRNRGQLATPEEAQAA